MLVCRTRPAAISTTAALPAGKGATVSYAAYAATTVGFALPAYDLKRSGLKNLGFKYTEQRPGQRLNR